MECNRDEALRAKAISERKFLAKDFKGAKKFALKAKNLCPDLEGLSQMLLTFDVYVSAQDPRIPGTSNWYGVLGVTPLDDEETIRKQYRKLALLLHPDKNRSIGSEGAFQLVSQAWSLLSDKSKRMAYDKSCGGIFQSKNQTSYNFANTVSSKGTDPVKKVSKRNASCAPRSSQMEEKDTFWTVCHRCRMQYEYLRIYRNHNLLCPNCQEAYFAVEIDPPSNQNSKTMYSCASQQQRKAKQPGSGITTNLAWQQEAFDSHRSKNSSNCSFGWTPFQKSPDAHSAVQAANMVKEAYEKVKRERLKAQSASRKQEALLRRNLSSRKRVSGASSSNPNASKRCKGDEDSNIYKEKPVDLGSAKPDLKQNDASNIRQILIKKACSEICEKLSTCLSTSVVKNAASVEFHDNSIERTSCTQHELPPTECRLSENELDQNPSHSCPERNSIDQLSLHVHESDFHDFDMSRGVHFFGKNQVWAVYDDDDGMPRHYAMIQSVVSLNPFRARMSWLSSVTHSRSSNASWYSNGFSRTCGKFRLGKQVCVDSVDYFSHHVRWKKCTSSTILIYPRKGDIWALYRNWSLEWNELTEDEVVHKYDIVEVLEDCDDELGVVVIPLVKVVGSKAIFHQHLDPSQIRRIPCEEITRFSHQVPSHLFTGQQGLKLLKGCRELDPAAVPFDLLEAASLFIEGIDAPENVHIVEEIDSKENRTSNPVVGVTLDDAETVKQVDIGRNLPVSDSLQPASATSDT